MNLVPLSSLNYQQRAIVDHIVMGNHGKLLINRLQAMGLVAGTSVKVLRKFWLGGPLQVQVGITTIIAIRRIEADLIMVKLT
ncbi:ferrous iron transport protein A [Cyanobacterium stanieri LEGE 03274]|uniref:Ferrous iron transport protein A n=1 Tax=Cyanobacterium stanieri LEGE 03274 TaxID=1828756 RepID=A0ABR9V900_9CHRO|nr:FeoA family protein [Cyanobacterium stanieri]MBE9223626.1 ferrous iron transport protein A [Cyanobacterium stanieri LEGE 03274]